MTTTRTKPIITIVILLVVLALLSVTSLVTTQLLTGAGRQRPQGTFNGTPGPRNGTTQQGGNAGGIQGNNGGADNGGNFRGGNGGGGNFQGRGGGGGAFAIFGAARQLGIDPRVMGYIGLGISVISILLVLWCAFGVWKLKKKALNWAMVLAILFLLTGLPGLFFGGGFNVLRLVMNILQVGAAATIIGLSVLPSVRDSVE